MILTADPDYVHWCFMKNQISKSDPELNNGNELETKRQSSFFFLESIIRFSIFFFLFDPPPSQFAWYFSWCFDSLKCGGESAETYTDLNLILPLEGGKVVELMLNKLKC